MLSLLDTHAAYLAAQRRTDEQAERLVAIGQALMVAAERNDPEAWEEIDHPYHETLLDASCNTFLRRSIEDVRRRLQRLTYHLAVQPEHLLLGTQEHVALAQAIHDGRAEAAADIMRQHLDTMHTMAMRLIRTHIVPVRGERF
jgi:DNA-binding FadR family transcriptional regulator